MMISARLSSSSCQKCWTNVFKPYLGTRSSSLNNATAIKPKPFGLQNLSNRAFSVLRKIEVTNGNQLGNLNFVRFASNKSGGIRQRQRTTLIYICAIGVAMVGGAYAGVPLYRIFCQATGLGGQPTQGHKVEELDVLKKVDDRILTIQFNADTASSMQWSFRPQQAEIKVMPGETALAFYTAKNPTDKPIVGISTYNIIPFEAGPYFNKIQCFCFEEQRLNPYEQVDMPVFFYIDPEIVDDPKCESIRTIMLSYTFFEAKEGFEVPVPPYLREWRTAI